MSAGSVFRAYDIRGIVDQDFNGDWVQNLGRACGTYLRCNHIEDAVVGYDCRNSSAEYSRRLIAGMLASGINVINIGRVPTPALYYAVRHLNRRGGVMITASHNPPQYNGFKVWAGDSTIHGAEIQKIKDIMEQEDYIAGNGLASTHDIMPSYKQDIVSRFTLKRPVKVVVDGGNGMGGATCAEILTNLGAEVIPLFCEADGNFPNHHPDPVVKENMLQLIAKVQETQADFGIGLDGDADRIGIVDSNGRLLFGDEVLSLYARELLERLPGSTIIADVKCSARLFRDIAEHGGKPLMWTTGHSIIKAKMRETDSPLAGEMSGHMFFSDNWYGFDDAIYGSARLAALFSCQDSPMTDLPGWPQAFSTPEINIPCDDDKKFSIVEKIKAFFRTKYETIEIDGARVNFPHGWGLVRASNTQPVLVTRFEADSAEALEEIRQSINEPLKQWIEESHS
ncbi:MAG: phosphomannomutase/phosphoglucomutase [Desulfovibrionaceae bacterium]|nr:phosphomannomutase/phosphoglucomutase [Desulfovibrionaceae bacterium]